MNIPVLYNRLKSFFLSKPKITSGIFFCILVIVASFAIYQRHGYLKEVEKTNALNLLNVVENNIEQTINAAVVTTLSLALSVDDEGKPVGFEDLGRQLVDENPFIDGIQLVPEGIIKYVYPYEINKTVLNYDILSDPKTSKEAHESIDQKKFYIAGPFELKQGGVAVVGRLPIFRQNTFWGFSAVIINLATLFKNAGIDTTSTSGYYYQFSKVNPNTLKEEKFLPVRTETTKGYLASTKFQESNWIISIIPVNKYSIFYGLYLTGLISLIAAGSFSTLLYTILNRPEKLERLVIARTRELENTKIAIQKSEENYRTLIERVSDGFVAMDKNWHYTYVNKNAGEMLGRTSENLIGKNMWEEFPTIKEEPLDLYNAYMESVRSQKSATIEKYYSPLNKWFESIIYPSEEGISIYFLDITERKKAELEIEEKQKQLEFISNHVPFYLALLDANKIYKFVNEPYASLFDLNPNNLIGIHAREILGEDAFNNAKPYMDNAIEGHISDYELEFKQEDGVKIFNVKYIPEFDSDEKVKGFIAAISDITEQKKSAIILNQSLQRNTAFLNAIPDMIFVINNEGVFTDFHNSTEKESFSSPEHFLNKHISESLPPDLAADTLQNIKIVLENKKITIHHYHLEYPFGKHHFEARYAALNETEVLVIVRDVTVLKDSEETILQLNRDLEKRVRERTMELETVNKELESFSYSVSHDLRAPLRSITGFSQILMNEYKDKLDEEAHRLFTKIKNNAAKMSVLIDGLLNFSRLGRTEIIRSKINNSNLVHEIIKDEMQRNPKRNIEWDIKNLPELSGDYLLIRQVWENYILNAVKYSRNKDKAVIEIGAFTEDEETIYYVKDNGAGFDMTYADKLFGVFQRLHNDAEFEGTGVGLANVHKIVSKHGGKVWAEGEPGKGASFYFTIPDNII